MQDSRFVFLSLSGRSVGGEVPAGEVTAWMLVSPNNRPLGRGRHTFATYGACRDAVLHLREHHPEVAPVVSATEETGQWVWRAELSGLTVALSSRSYLRARECHYNLERFLEAVPTAQMVAGTRSVRGGSGATRDAIGRLTVT